MDHRRLWLVGLVTIALSGGCNRVAPDDASRLAAIQARFGARVKVDIDDQIYLSARGVGEDPLDEATARQLFAMFFVDGQKPRATEVVYLNIYDTASVFQYQLYFDGATNAIVRQEGVEHY